MKEDKITIQGSNESIKIFQIEPSCSLTFRDTEKEIGRLDWGDGELKFKGTVEKSANVFLDFLKPYIDAYINDRK